MKKALNNPTLKPLKKVYVAPSLEQVQIDIEISLVMSSPPPPHPQMPQMPGNWPEGIVQKIFKFGW